MKLLLDQGLSRLAAELLRQSGHDAVHVGELGMAHAKDHAIIARATTDRAVIVTRDIDFHTELALSGAAGPSVIRVNLEGWRADQQAALVQRIVTRYEVDLISGAAITVDHRRIRVRSLPLT